MKKVMIVAAILLTTGLVMSQSRLELQGAKAKNYKPWKHQSDDKVVYFRTNNPNKTSLELKNTNPSKRSEGVELGQVGGNNERYELQGARAKNYKPWKS